MLDPELCPRISDQGLDEVEGFQSFRFVPVEPGDSPELPAELEVIEVSGEDDRSFVFEIDEEHLMSRRVTRCGNDPDPPVTKYVVVTLEQHPFEIG